MLQSPPPRYMRASCKTGIVASKNTGIAHVPGEFYAVFLPDGRVRFWADFLCRSGTNRGVILSSWDDAPQACAVCRDASRGPGVYRCLNSTGYPVYIGSAIACLKRVKRHEAKASWWPEVADVRTEHFPTIFEAREAERLAIIAEKPLRNTLHNKQCRRSA